MKKVSWLVLILILMLINVDVYAYSTWRDSSGNRTDHGVGGSNSPSDYNLEGVGFRITLVDDTGRTVSGTHSYDYWHRGSVLNNRTYMCKNSLSSQNKQALESCNVGVDTYTSRWSGNYHVISQSEQSTYLSGAIAGRVISWYFGSYNERELTESGQKGSGNYFANAAARKLTNMVDRDDPDTTLLETYLRKVGWTQGLAAASSNKYSIQIEPISVMKYKGTFYTGSTTQLASYGIFSHSNGSSTWYFTSLTGAYPIIWSSEVEYNGQKLSRVAGINLCRSVGTMSAGNTARKNGCEAVAVFYLPTVAPSCNDLAIEFNKTREGWKKFDNYKNFGTIDEAITQLMRDNSFYSNFNSFDSNDYIRVLNKNVREIFGYPTKDRPAKNASSEGACGTIDCQSIADEIYRKYYVSNKTKYNSYINWLYEKTGHNKLRESVWKELGLPGPLCEPTPDCSVNLPNLACNDDEKEITFKDNSNEVCWKQNYIAYSVGNEIQSSVYKNNVKPGCNVVCYDETTFKFPGNVTTEANAGTVFKWGIASEQKIFGTVSISKKCSIVKVGRTADCSGTYTIGDTNAADIRKLSDAHLSNMQAMINYREATTVARDGMYVDEGLLKTTITSSRSNKNTVTCSRNGGDCTFTLTANYNISYAEVTSDKLYWYSSKDDSSFVSKAKNVVNNNNKAYYYEIGYGLPVAFTTPKGEYTGLSAKVKSVGTKNLIGNTDNGHYDRLLIEKNHLAEGYFTYDCKFKVKNPIFGNECEYENGVLSPNAPDYCRNKVKSIDVVFRTIHLMADDTDEQLNRAFPGRTASNTKGRERGENWTIGENDHEYTNADLHHILREDVYTESNRPMYQITLTPATIQKIRKLNDEAKNAGIDPYTEMTVNKTESGANGQIGYHCLTRNEYTFCASKFLTYLQSLGTNSDGVDVSLHGHCMGGVTSARASRYVETSGCLQN